MSPDILQDLLPEFGMTQRAPGKADDNHAFRQGTLLVEIEQGGKILRCARSPVAPKMTKKAGSGAKRWASRLQTG